MSTTEAELIDLEPTSFFEKPDLGLSSEASPPRRTAPVSMLEGTFASLAGETHDLRRSRLAAIALLLCAVFLILFGWSIFSWASDIKSTWIMMIARFVLAGTVLGLLMSPFASTRGRVRFLEVLLFGGLTLLLVISQYTINYTLMQRGNVLGVVASVKNGVIQMIVMMFLYGAFIPNHPKTVAKVVLAMALAPLIGFSVLTEREDIAEIVEQLGQIDLLASNVLFLLIGAGMATYGAWILNGLRAELHQARKFGQYKLLKKIGEGGMGEVHLAEHELLKRPCALKLIKPEAGTDPLALARFEREVRSAARLAHPNTIEIFDYGHTDDGTFYYVMEYLKGMSLSDLVKDAGSLPAGRVIYLFRQVCAGMAEAHGLGLVHRDMKPANVFVAVRGGESDIAKVLDFGLVKLTRDTGSAELTSDMTVSGTPLYMAPEQALGDRSIDGRADIYAIGAMIYYALTGQPPFQGESAVAVMIAHSRDPVVPPSELVHDIPDDLERVVLRCLAKKADERYPNVKSLGQALAACTAVADWDAEKADQWWSENTPADSFLSQSPASEE